jgi:hypothetical protein
VTFYSSLKTDGFEGSGSWCDLHSTTSCYQAKH